MTTHSHEDECFTQHTFNYYHVTEVPIHIPSYFTLVFSKFHENFYEAFKGSDLIEQKDLEELKKKTDQYYQNILQILGFTYDPFPAKYQVFLETFINAQQTVQTNALNYKAKFNDPEINRNISKNCFSRLKSLSFQNIDSPTLMSLFTLFQLTRNSTFPQDVCTLFRISLKTIDRFELVMLFPFLEIKTYSERVNQDFTFGGCSYNSKEQKITFYGNKFKINIPYSYKSSQALFHTDEGDITLNYEINHESNTSKGNIFTIFKNGIEHKYYQKPLYCSVIQNTYSKIIESRKYHFIDQLIHDMLFQSSIGPDNYQESLIECKNESSLKDYLLRFFKFDNNHDQMNKAMKIIKKAAAAVQEEHTNTINNIWPELRKGILISLSYFFERFPVTKHVNVCHELYGYLILKNTGYVPNFQAFKSLFNQKIQIFVEDVGNQNVVFSQNYQLKDGFSFAEFLSLISLHELQIIRYLFLIDDLVDGNIAYTFGEIQSSNNDIKYISNVLILDLWPSYDILTTEEVYPCRTNYSSDSLLLELQNRYLNCQVDDIEVPSHTFDHLDFNDAIPDYKELFKSKDLRFRQSFLVFLSLTRFFNRICEFVQTQANIHRESQTDELQSEIILDNLIELSGNEIQNFKNMDTFNAEYQEEIQYLKQKSKIALNLLIYDLYKKMESYFTRLSVFSLMSYEQTGKNQSMLLIGQSEFERIINNHDIKEFFFILLTPMKYEEMAKECMEKHNDPQQRMGHNMITYNLMSSLIPDIENRSLYVLATASPIIFDLYTIRLNQCFEMFKIQSIMCKDGNILALKRIYLENE